VTTKDLIDSLPEALLQDERLLSARERELLASILRHARNYENVPGSKVAESVARAIGETVAQRAFAVLGDRILQNIERQTTSSVELLAGVRLGTGPLPAPSPSPTQQPGPRPPSPSPPSPNAISARRREGAISPFGGPQPPSTYRTRTETASVCQEGSVVVVDAQEILPAQCVVFEEFLVPAELEALMSYTLEHEADFQVSEVLSPGVTGGTVNHEHRRSRVLTDAGAQVNPLLDRVKACLPRVLPKLGLGSFPIAHQEAQITASNQGDFFRWHSDNAQEEIATREITFVYFFHREPKRFHGGELRIYDSLHLNGTYVPTTSYRAIVPRQNQIVFFRSSLAHEITPVECPTGAFGDSRFTVNGWFHR
jgi:SM-20-related protein